MANEGVREEFKALREMGLSKEKAGLLAFSNSTYDDFLKQLENGPLFDDDAARLAAVHTRLDIALLNYNSSVQIKLLQSIVGWVGLACIAVIIAALIVAANS